MRPVVSQTSAQSRSSRMQRRIAATSDSLRQASAHAVQVCAHSTHAAMHSANASRSKS
jgi:hypothetical protein